MNNKLAFRIILSTRDHGAIVFCSIPLDQINKIEWDAEGNFWRNLPGAFIFNAYPLLEEENDVITGITAGFLEI